MLDEYRDLVIQASYFVTAALFILGLKRMSSPVTARSGITWAGAGMLVATAVTFAYPGMSNYEWIIPAILLGGGYAWWSGKRVAITDMPQMIALYNGMGGGAAAAIAAVELYRGEMDSYAASVLAVVGGIIGAVSFSGSAIAFGKLQGLIKRSVRFSGQQILNLLLLVAALVVGGLVALHLNSSPTVVTTFFVLALVLGLTMTLPIGGADMPSGSKASCSTTRR
jgi:NAD(P) transhydrogenase subunit beta